MSVQGAAGRTAVAGGCQVNDIKYFLEQRTAFLDSYSTIYCRDIAEGCYVANKKPVHMCRIPATVLGNSASRYIHTIEETKW
jgi:hypothetical protein